MLDRESIAYEINDISIIHIVSVALFRIDSKILPEPRIEACRDIC